MNRNYSKFDVNLALRNITCNNYENPLTFYNLWASTIKEQIDNLSKKIYVREIKTYRVTRETRALRKSISQLKKEKKVISEKIKILKKNDNEIVNLKQELGNKNNEIKNFRLKLKNEIMTETQLKINKEISQLQKNDFRSLKYYKKIKQQVKRRSPTEANYIFDENKNKITNKTPIERIKGAAVIEKYCENLYNELNDFDEYRDWTNLVEQSNNKKRIEYITHNDNKFNLFDLKKIIRGLKNNKATGADGITNEILKMLDDQNLETFLEILNRLYKNNLVPEAWNIGMVTLLYKGKGSKGDPANYRGITVNSNIVKIVEKLMYRKYYRQINLSELQGGSKKGSSTRDHIFILLTLMKKYKRRGFTYSLP